MLLVKKGRMDIQWTVSSVCHPNLGIVSTGGLRKTVTFIVRLERRMANMRQGRVEVF